MKQVLKHAAIDQAEQIIHAAHEEFTVESRIETLIEVIDGVAFEQEQVNLIDRIRNTENEITVSLNCSNMPVVQGQVRFTSERFLVLKNQNGNFLINLVHTNYFLDVDQRAVFRIENVEIDTTSMWIKNLTQSQSRVSIYLVNGLQISGQLIRFSHDHLDLLVNQQTYLIPITNLVTLRSSS